MKIVRCDSAEEFLAATLTYRGRDPIRTNVFGSVAVAVAEDARQYDECWWWLVVNNEDEVVGAAFRTAPFGLQLGPMPAGATAPLASAVVDADRDFPWLVGRDELVTAFLEAYGDFNARVFLRGRNSLLYELGDLVNPVVAGTYRNAAAKDLELVAQWTDDFHYFVDGVLREPDDRDRAFLEERVATGTMKLWCVGPVAVAMAGHANPVDTPSGVVTRIGPVFTPAENRGRGYGSAVTAALSQELLARHSRVMLYADADNPTSNDIYQRIGFRVIDDVVQFDFVTED